MPYLCTVSRRTLGNWDLCKEVGLWGIPGATRTRMSHVDVGDAMYVWLGSTGFIAECLVDGKPRAPLDESELPWPGGRYRWTTVVPFKISIELRTPLFLPFDAQQQQAVTGLFKGNFQRSFAPISAKVAAKISELIHKAGDDAETVITTA